MRDYLRVVLLRFLALAEHGTNMSHDDLLVRYRREIDGPTGPMHYESGRPVLGEQGEDGTPGIPGWNVPRGPPGPHRSLSTSGGIYTLTLPLQKDNDISYTVPEERKLLLLDDIDRKYLLALNSSRNVIISI